MKCVRYQEDKQAQYRVFTEIMDIIICADCTGEARGPHIGIEVLETERRKNEPADEYMRQAS